VTCSLSSAIATDWQYSQRELMRPKLLACVQRATQSMFMAVFGTQVSGSEQHTPVSMPADKRDLRHEKSADALFVFGKFTKRLNDLVKLVVGVAGFAGLLAYH
jgi:hypothetical protein